MSEEEVAIHRKEIDRIDKAIVKLLEKRTCAAKKIGAIKKKKNLPISDPKREEEVIKKAVAATELDKAFVKSVFKKIIEYCKNEEKKQGRRPRP